MFSQMSQLFSKRNKQELYKLSDIFNLKTSLRCNRAWDFTQNIYSEGSYYLIL